MLLYDVWHCMAAVIPSEHLETTLMQAATLVQVERMAQFIDTMQPEEFVRARGHLFKDIGGQALLFLSFCVPAAAADCNVFCAFAM
jgi:hypothetical protein